MHSDALLVVRLALGTVFALSAVGKLRDPKGFARGVIEYQVIPASLAYPFGFFFIVLESWLAIAHLTGWLLTAAIPVALGTLASFATAVGVNLRRGRVLPCYCFGNRTGEQISPRTLVRTLFLAGAELFLLAVRGLVTRNQIVYSGRIESFSELGLAFFWATFVLVTGSWVFVSPEFVDALRPREAD